MNRFEVYKETTDDWCPNYHENLVKVTFHGNITRPKQDIPVYLCGVTMIWVWNLILKMKK